MSHCKTRKCRRLGAITKKYNHNNAHDRGLGWSIEWGETKIRSFHHLECIRRYVAWSVGFRKQSDYDLNEKRLAYKRWRQEQRTKHWREKWNLRDKQQISDNANE